MLQMDLFFKQTRDLYYSYHSGEAKDYKCYAILTFACAGGVLSNSGLQFVTNAELALSLILLLIWTIHLWPEGHLHGPDGSTSRVWSSDFPLHIAQNIALELHSFFPNPHSNLTILQTMTMLSCDVNVKIDLFNLPRWNIPGKGFFFFWHTYA